MGTTSRHDTHSDLSRPTAGSVCSARRSADVVSDTPRQAAARIPKAAHRRHRRAYITAGDRRTVNENQPAQRQHRLPARVVAWVIFGYLLALAGVIAASVDDRYGPWDYLRGGVVLGSACLYLWYSSDAEERRRDQLRIRASHIDQTSAILLPAAVLLPMPLAIVVLIAVRGHRYRIARTPMFRMAFSTSAIAVSMVSAHAIALGTGLRHSLLGDDAPPPHDQPLLLALMVVLIGAAAVYCAVRIVRLLIGAVQAGLQSQRWSQKTLGSLKKFLSCGQARKFSATAVGVGISVMLVQRHGLASFRGPIGILIHASSVYIAALMTPIVVLASAAAAYFAGQTVLIGGVRGLEFQKWSLKELVGSLEANTVFGKTLLVGAVATALTAQRASLVLLPVVALLVAEWTRLLQRRARDEAERDKLLACVEGERTDELTGLLRRRSFKPMAHAALAVDPESTLLVIDLDKLKYINDQFGLPGGDRVLEVVAQTLVSSTRHDEALICRWGGDEYVVLLPGRAQAAAITIAERIRRNVEIAEVTVTTRAGGYQQRVYSTVTIGIASAPQQGSTLLDLVDIAGRAAARGKRHGQNNRVVVAGDRGYEQPLPLEFAQGTPPPAIETVATS